MIKNTDKNISQYNAKVKNNDLDGLINKNLKIIIYFDKIFVCFHFPIWSMHTFSVKGQINRSLKPFLTTPALQYQCVGVFSGHMTRPLICISQHSPTIVTHPLMVMLENVTKVAGLTLECLGTFWARPRFPFYVDVNLCYCDRNECTVSASGIRKCIFDVTWRSRRPKEAEAGLGGSPEVRSSLEPFWVMTPKSPTTRPRKDAELSN